MGAYGSGLYGSGIYPGSTQDGDFRKFVVEPIILVEMRFSTGTKYLSMATLRYSTAEYQGKILSMSPIKRAMQRNLGLYEISSVTIEIDDSDRVFSAIAEPIKGTIVVIKVSTISLGLSEAKTLFIGKIDDYVINDFKISYSLKDTFLDIPEFPTTGFIDETSFPNSLKEVRGFPIPVCYGTHAVTSDDDNRNRGAWPTLYVDNSSDAKKFLIAGHAVKSIDRVYVNKPSTGSTDLTAAGAPYTLFPAGTIAGKNMSWVQFTNSQFTTNIVDSGSVGDVRVNVVGKEDVGNGSGAAFTNPIDVLLDFLANYCGNPSIDGPTMTTTKSICTSRGYIVKGGYSEKTTVQNVLSDFVRSFNMMLFLTSEGNVSVNIVDPSTIDIGGDLFDEARDIIRGSWNLDRQSQVEGAEDAIVINSIDYSYDYHHGNKKLSRSNKSSDSASISQFGMKTLVLEMPWAADQTTANDVVARILHQFKKPVAHAEFRTILKCVQVELAERFLASHANGPNGIAWNQRSLQMLSSSFNPSDYSVSIRGRDIEDLISGAYFFGDE